MSKSPRGSETVWHIQQRLNELGHKVSSDGLLPLSSTAWDRSETLNAVLKQLGGPVKTVADEKPVSTGNNMPDVYLEIGHGPKDGRFDPGAVHASSKTTEHELNKIGANACADVLKKAGCKVTVGDYRESNYRAGQRAKGNDIVISFHHNAAGGRAQGAEALYDPRGYNSDDKRLAGLVAANMADELKIKNRGAKPMKLSVLSGARNVGVPTAVLAELYFIHQQSPDNPSACDMPDWSKRAGQAIANSILEFAK